jgi:hypothetical protein
MKTTIRKLPILIILLLTLTPQILKAEPIVELEATPSVLTEDDSKLLITEISFKNKQADWVEMYYQSPVTDTINLKGISFADDKAFKKVENLNIRSGTYILLSFKSEQQDSSPYLYTQRSGLTGTTEQFIIYDANGQILDAVCWTSSKPTTSEEEELAQLYDLEGWQSPLMTSCINSEEIKSDQTIIRKDLNDTNTSADWFISSEPTPAAMNIYTETPESMATQETQTENAQTNVEEQGTISEATSADEKTGESESEDESETPKTSAKSTPTQIAKQGTVSKTTTAAKETTAKSTTKKTTAKKTTKAAAATYNNGDLSEEIIISEIMPNPEGSDTKSEWIELFNQSEEDINLGNWTLDDEEGGSKPFTLSDETIIPANGTLLIPITDSKISLSNTQDEVRLADFEGTIISETSYEEAPSGESYAMITVISENASKNASDNKKDAKETQQWLWQKTPTPNEPNPNYSEISVQIVNPPQEENPYAFEVKTSSGKSLTITYNEDTLPAALAIASIIKDEKIKMVIKENGEDDEYELIQYEILEKAQPAQTDDFVLPSIISGILTAGGSTFYFLRKRIKFAGLANIFGK